MKTESYLSRFSAEKKSKPDLEFLRLLQRLHLETVPFENLDVIREIPISLDVERFFQKVVRHKRGGFCYELNGLFHWLLAQLGYNTHLISCTVFRPDGSWAIKNSHASILVHLDEPYLVDVGFGDSARQPLPLSGTEKCDASGTYKIKPVDSHFFDLCRKEEEHWKPLYRFSVQPKRLGDFEEGCIFNQTSPRSTFTHTDIVTIATKSGRITLTDTTLTISENNQKTKRELTREEKQQALKEYFDLEL